MPVQVNYNYIYWYINLSGQSIAVPSNLTFFHNNSGKKYYVFLRQLNARDCPIKTVCVIVPIKDLIQTKLTATYCIHYAIFYELVIIRMNIKFVFAYSTINALSVIALNIVALMSSSKNSNAWQEIRKYQEIRKKEKLV
jgi:hypothetical protein